MKQAILFLLFSLLVNKNIVFSQKLPIAPERTIEITTDEGSYMNVDVSPDGKTLLFDMLGEIFMLPSEGGQAIQLTRGLALNLRPVWAGDGKRFAYTSDAENGPGIHVRDIAGSYDSVFNHVLLGQDVNISGRSPVSADKILNRDPGQGYLSPNNRWWVYRKDTGDKKSLFALDLFTGAEKVLASSLFPKPYGYRPFIFDPHFSFSPDSKYVFISYNGKIHKISIEEGTDEIVPFIAHVKCDLGAYVYNQFDISYDSLLVRYTRSANKSANGKWLAFSALNKIHLLNIATGSVKLLINDSLNQFQPVFSPDEKWIAYVSWSDSVGGALWRVSVTSGDREQLTKISGNYQRPVWSPDGKQIAVIYAAPRLLDRDDEGKGKIEIINVRTKTIHVVDDDVPIWNHISFTADGRRLIYQPAYTTSEEDTIGTLLVSRSIENSDLQLLIVTTREDSYMHENRTSFQHRTISPDGKWLAYSAFENIYLLRIDKLPKPFVFNLGLPIVKVGDGVDPFWENGGKILSWSHGNEFYSINCNTVLDSIGSRDWQKLRSVKMKPDKKITITIKTPAFFQRGSFVFRNARIITMKGAEIIDSGAILINDGRIVAIGTSASIKAPPKAREFDLKGKTIIPGFVDAHLHMRVYPDIFPQQSWMFSANLAYGVTTARDPSLSYDGFGFEELVNSGRMIGPRLFSVGWSMSYRRIFSCNNLEEARELVKKRVKMGAITIKQYMLNSRIERQWMLMATREAGLNMTNEGAVSPIEQLAMIKDGSTGVEHNPLWGDVYSDILQFVAKSNIYLTPTLQVVHGVEHAKQYLNYKYWRHPDTKMRRFIISDTAQKGPTLNGYESLETILSAVPKDTSEASFLAPSEINTRMLRAGANIVLGSHGNDQGIGVHNELWALQMGGMSNMEALRCATINGARALGLQNHIGSLEPEKIADFLVLNSNPLDNIQNSRDIMYVIKDGVVYDGNTLARVELNK